MASRRYLTQAEREDLYDKITAQALIALMEKWAREHPEIPEDEPRHQEGIDWSLKGLSIVYEMLNQYDLVPRSDASRSARMKEVTDKEKENA